MNKQQILEIAKNDPRFSKAVLTLENEIGDMPVTGEGLDEIVKLLEFALNHPENYAEIIASAVKDGMMEQGSLPEQFNPVAIISLLVLMYGMQERTKQKGFAKGGLASLGRNGDTMLAHINPREAEMLKRMGGSGEINPNTGYPEYGWFKKFLAVALPIALDFIAPGLGTTIGTSLGLSGTAAAMAGLYRRLLVRHSSSSSSCATSASRLSSSPSLSHSASSPTMHGGSDSANHSRTPSYPAGSPSATSAPRPLLAALPTMSPLHLQQQQL
jgi:hypothetical protein